MLLLTILCSAAVGLLIGWSGIAGFLLPIFYTGVLGMDQTSALVVSFALFLVSGSLGAYSYYRKGQLRLTGTGPLFLGSFVGGVGGVMVHTRIPADWVIIILYIVVLVSGISLLVRVFRDGKNSHRSQEETLLVQKPVLLFFFGVATAALCTFSGAGGPVLVMPILILWGLDAKYAVGLALLDSVFIALPSVVGYSLLADLDGYGLVFTLSLVSHAAGVWAGGRSAKRIKQQSLKLAVGLFSTLLAGWKLFALLW